MLKGARRLCAAGLGAAVWLLLSSPAMAEIPFSERTPEQVAEVNCVMDAIRASPDEAVAIGAYYAGSLGSLFGLDTLDDNLAPFKKQCRDQYGWDDEQAGAAGYLGEIGTAKETMASVLVDRGSSARDVALALKTVEVMTGAEYNALWAAGYRTDPAARDRLTGLMQQQGVVVTRANSADLMDFMFLALSLGEAQAGLAHSLFD